MLWWTRMQLKSESADVRKKAVQALAQSRARQAPALLAAVLRTDPKFEIRQRAAQALGERDAPEWVSEIVGVLDDADPHTRGLAAKALRKGGKGRVEDFTKLLTDAHWPAREEATQALLSLGWRPANKSEESLVGIVRALGPSKYLPGIDERGRTAYTPQITANAARIIEELGTDAFEHLTVMLGSADTDRRGVAGKAIHAILGQSQNPEFLRAALGSPVPEVREGAATGLGRLRSARSVDALVFALDDPEDQVSDAAATALGAIGERSAVLPLMRRALLQRGRRSSYDALGQLRHPLAVDMLLDLFIDGSDYKSFSIDALRKIGDPRSLDRLEKWSLKWAPNPSKEFSEIFDSLRQAPPLPAVNFEALFGERLRALANHSTGASDPSRWRFEESDPLYWEYRSSEEKAKDAAPETFHVPTIGDFKSIARSQLRKAGKPTEGAALEEGMDELLTKKYSASYASDYRRLLEGLEDLKRYTRGDSRALGRLDRAIERETTGFFTRRAVAPVSRWLWYNTVMTKTLISDLKASPLLKSWDRIVNSDGQDGEIAEIAAQYGLLHRQVYRAFLEVRGGRGARVVKAMDTMIPSLGVVNSHVYRCSNEERPVDFPPYLLLVALDGIDSVVDATALARVFHCEALSSAIAAMRAGMSGGS